MEVSDAVSPQDSLREWNIPVTNCTRVDDMIRPPSTWLSPSYLSHICPLIYLCMGQSPWLVTGNDTALRLWPSNSLRSYLEVRVTIDSIIGADASHQDVDNKDRTIIKGLLMQYLYYCCCYWENSSVAAFPVESAFSPPLRIFPSINKSRKTGPIFFLPASHSNALAHRAQCPHRNPANRFTGFLFIQRCGSLSSTSSCASRDPGKGSLHSRWYFVAWHVHDPLLDIISGRLYALLAY